VRTYEIRNREGKLAAQAVVEVDYEAPDKKTFHKTSEKGSGIVRRLVFDRLLQSEGETSSGREHHDSAITNANYAFKFVAEEDLGSYHCFVLEATPKRKDKYLFEGKIKYGSTRRTSRLQKLRVIQLRNRLSGLIGPTSSGNIRESRVFGFLTATRRSLK
jgi:hypothetical protein